MSDLPRNWTQARIEELAANEPGALTDGPFGSNLKTSHYTPEGPRVIRLQNIGDGEFTDEQAHISEDHFDNLRRYEAKAGDVVVAMLGENLPRACVVPSYVGPAIVKADCARLRTHSRLSSSPYVSHALNSHQVRSQAANLVHGVGRPRLGLKLLRTLMIPLAPPAEQHRIAETIDSYFTRLDEAEATLERVQRNLERYRASVLNAAVEGRLVPTEAELARAEGRDYEPASVLLERILAERRRRWEEAELARLESKGKAPTDDKWKSKYREPVAPNTSGLPALPDGWTWASVDQLESGDRRCAYGVLVPGEDVSDGVPFIRVGDIDNGNIDVSGLKHISREISDRFAKTYLRGGEILLTLVGTIGRTAVVPRSLAGANVARAVGVIPPSDLVEQHWIEFWFRSPAVRYLMISKAHEVARKTLNLEDVRSAAIALPPGREQLRIREAVQDIESIIDSVFDEVGATELRCSRLRQGVLKWAFEGRLVDQDPTDEPASELLARIRAEREAAEVRSPRNRDRRKTKAAKA